MEQDSAARSGEGRRTAFAGWRKPPWLRRVLWRSEDAGETLGGWLDRELAERVGFHWLAVCFGIGALGYFTLPREPILAALAVPALVVAAAAWVAYRRGAPWRILTIAAICLAGAGAAICAWIGSRQRMSKDPFSSG